MSAGRESLGPRLAEESHRRDETPRRSAVDVLVQLFLLHGGRRLTAADHVADVGADQADAAENEIARLPQPSPAVAAVGGRVDTAVERRQPPVLRVHELDVAGEW